MRLGLEKHRDVNVPGVALVISDLGETSIYNRSHRLGVIKAFWRVIRFECNALKRHTFYDIFILA